MTGLETWSSSAVPISGSEHRVRYVPFFDCFAQSMHFLLIFRCADRNAHLVPYGIEGPESVPYETPHQMTADEIALVGPTRMHLIST
jgi:hypothetical protein